MSKKRFGLLWIVLAVSTSFQSNSLYSEEDNVSEDLMSSNPISFGDRVRVRSIPTTEEKGLAGLIGQVYGETTPSVTGVEVIGEVKSDYAINVNFENRKGEFWFTPDLLEFIDHGAGTEIHLQGVPKKWVRTSQGEWAEEPAEAYQRTRKPWWKFW